ncbi:MAG: hypothetical protein AVDCRST_MAG91-3710, partial [uncultured Sphingomonadaceae bacterium]
DRHAPGSPVQQPRQPAFRRGRAATRRRRPVQGRGEDQCRGVQPVRRLDPRAGWQDDGPPGPAADDQAVRAGRGLVPRRGREGGQRAARDGCL